MAVALPSPARRVAARLLLVCMGVCGATGGGAPPRWMSTDLGGPVQDAQCNVETVEAANSLQLAAVLSEVRGTRPSPGLEHAP